MEETSKSSDKERIIPITILSSRHHDKSIDVNDNKRLSMPNPGVLGATANNNNQATLEHGESSSKRRSLVVTLEDGTVTETQGTIYSKNWSG